jgi:hypothetical protein
MTVHERLLARTADWGIEVDDRCWEMTGGGPKGYVYFTLDGRRMLAHRVVAALYVADPAGLLVCHRCDNPRCVRPSHLFLGTHAENTADMMTKGRNANPRRTDCRRGHVLTDDNVYIHPDGSRECRACRAARSLSRVR